MPRVCRKKPPLQPQIFTAAEIAVLDQARIISRGLVAERFRLDFDDFASRPVDIKLFSDLRPEEKTPGVLAQLFRYGRSGPVLKDARPDFYRICLYDPAILKVLEREPGLTLPALLTYILTHEFIHVARFARFLELFAADDPARAAEEALVHRETSELLKTSRLKGLELVLELYEQHRLPMN